jgi:hypothetical protein
MCQIIQMNLVALLQPGDVQGHSPLHTKHSQHQALYPNSILLLFQLSQLFPTQTHWVASYLFFHKIP